MNAQSDCLEHARYSPIEFVYSSRMDLLKQSDELREQIRNRINGLLVWSGAKLVDERDHLPSNEVPAY
jgi:hypothetical protein